MYGKETGQSRETKQDYHKRLQNDVINAELNNLRYFFTTLPKRLKNAFFSLSPTPQANNGETLGNFTPYHTDQISRTSPIRNRAITHTAQLFQSLSPL